MKNDRLFCKKCKSKTAQEYWDEIKELPTFKADLLNLLKGEDVKDLAGVIKGYLLPEA